MVRTTPNTNSMQSWIPKSYLRLFQWNCFVFYFSEQQTACNSVSQTIFESASDIWSCLPSRSALDSLEARQLLSRAWEARLPNDSLPHCAGTHCASLASVYPCCMLREILPWFSAVNFWEDTEMWWYFPHHMAAQCRWSALFIYSRFIPLLLQLKDCPNAAYKIHQNYYIVIITCEVGTSTVGYATAWNGCLLFTLSGWMILGDIWS